MRKELICNVYGATENRTKDACERRRPLRVWCCGAMLDPSQESSKRNRQIFPRIQARVETGTALFPVARGRSFATPRLTNTECLCSNNLTRLRERCKYLSPSHTHSLDNCSLSQLPQTRLITTCPQAQQKI